MLGGTGVEGVANIVGCCADTTTMGPIPDTGDWVNDTSWLHDLPGYPVSDGSSFVIALEFTTDGPVAEGFLTYGNPDDPDGTGLSAWARGVERWRVATVPVPAGRRRVRFHFRDDGDHRVVGSPPALSSSTSRAPPTSSR